MKPVSLLALALIANSAMVSAKPTMAEYKTAKAAEAKEKVDKAAVDAKKGAVNKVITMLEDLQQEVTEEGEKEAKTYDKFSCFCKDMKKKKSAAIKKSKDTIKATEADLKDLGVKEAEYSKKISDRNDDLEALKKSKAALKAESEAAYAEYAKNEGDLSNAIYGVQEATKVLKASQGGSASLLQLQSIAKTVSTAVMLADALGLSSVQNADLSLLQKAPEVEMQNFNFHSSGIVATMEKLQDDFRTAKNDLDADEAKRVHTFKMAMQNNKDTVADKTTDLEEAKEGKDKTVEKTAAATSDLKSQEAILADDTEYLSSLVKDYDAKAKTYDQRSKLRSGELTALTQAIDIVKDTVASSISAKTVRFAQIESNLHIADAVANDEEAMMAIEAEAENTDAGTPMSFLQKRRAIIRNEILARNPDINQKVAYLLKEEGARLKSVALTDLSIRISADPLAKIKKLIQELIERQLQEAANEANQKGWCDKSTADAEQKRDYAAEKVENENSEMASLEARKDKLKEDIAVLTKEIKDIKASQAKTTALRADEKAENAATVKEAKEGLAATNMAIKILSQFYATSAKAKVSMAPAPAPAPAPVSLAQDAAEDDDAQPDPGFESGEAYKGSASAGGGIVAMLDVIASDFTRTIESTEKAEEAAVQEKYEFDTESGKSLAEKTVAKDEISKSLDDASEKLDAAEDTLEAQTAILAESIKELIKLKAACVDTGESYEDRKAKREDEIAALNKALKVIGE